MKNLEAKEVLEERSKSTLPMNIQFFASKGDDTTDDDSDDDEGGDDDDDDSDDDDSKGGKDDSTKGGKDSNKGNKSSKSEKTFTQEQVNRMMTREKKQGRNAALTELGVDPKDSKMVGMIKAFMESQKTDEQKQAEQKAQEDAKVSELEKKATMAEAKAEAMTLGVKPQYADDVVALAMSKMTDDSDLKTIIGEFKTKYPIWFGKSDDDEEDEGKNKGKKGTGSSIKTKKGGKDSEEKGLGARLAAQRKTSTKKSSYWGKN